MPKASFDVVLNALDKLETRLSAEEQSNLNSASACRYLILWGFTPDMIDAYLQGLLLTGCIKERERFELSMELRMGPDIYEIDDQITAHVNRALSLPSAVELLEATNGAVLQRIRKIKRALNSGFHQIHTFNAGAWFQSRHRSRTLLPFNIRHLSGPFIFFPPLNRVCVKASVLHGTGVFATQDLVPGDFCTFYPSHAVAIGDHPGINNVTFADFQPDPAYELSILAGCSICGNPAERADANWLGHLINDGARSTEALTPETYLEAAKANNNCAVRFHILDGETCAVSIACTRNVRAGEELLMTYGYSYWQL